MSTDRHIRPGHRTQVGRRREWASESKCSGSRRGLGEPHVALILGKRSKRGLHATYATQGRAHPRQAEPRYCLFTGMGPRHQRCRREPSKHQAPKHQVWWLSSPTPVQVHEDLGRRALCFDGQRGPSHGRQQTLPGFPFIQTNSFPLNRDQRIRTSALAACVPPTGLAPYFGQASSLEVTRKNAREGTRTCIGLPQRPAYLHKHRHCLQEGKTQKAPLLPTHLTTL